VGKADRPLRKRNDYKRTSEKNKERGEEKIWLPKKEPTCKKEGNTSDDKRTSLKGWHWGKKTQQGEEGWGLSLED